MTQTIPFQEAYCRLIFGLRPQQEFTLEELHSTQRKLLRVWGDNKAVAYVIERAFRALREHADLSESDTSRQPPLRGASVDTET